MWSLGSRGENHTNKVPNTTESRAHSNPCVKNMEEVWKEINLASLPENPSRKDPNTINFTGMIFQDFLARPSSKDPPPPSVYGPQATVLCLGSVSQSHFLGNSDLPLSQTTILQPLPVLNVPVDAVTSSSVMSSRGNRRRLPVTENYSIERRRKRLIKNRESAARSRARKQAYTIELELEVAHWRRENDRIKKQLQEFFLTAAQQPKKRTLQRTCTAPF